MLNSILLSATMLLLASKPIQAFNCATHTFGSCEDKIVHWYDPDDGLICDPLDCGGGRAAPKTDVPGCANYKGTSTRAGSSYLSCFKTKGLATSTKEAGVTTTSITSTPAAITTIVTSTAPTATATASPSLSQSSSQSSSAPILQSSTSSESTNPSSTSLSTSTASPSTTSAPILSSTTAQNGTAVSSSSSSAVPNAGGKVFMDSLMVVGLGMVGVVALA